jgi:hypothetical protein
MGFAQTFHGDRASAIPVRTAALRAGKIKCSKPPMRSGAHDRNRTGDLVLTKDVLYRLSYVGGLTLERVVGIEPTSSAWKAEVLPLNYTR